MEFKGTKGNWKAKGNSLADDNRIVETETHTVCRITGADFDTDEEMDANAQIIASAPDLLEALQLLKEAYEHECTLPNKIWLQNAEQAIKKAIG